MSVFALAPYSVRIRERSSTEYFPLDSIPLEDGKCVNILDVFKQYFEDFSNQPLDPDNKEYFRVEKFNEARNSIHGTFRSGESGYGSEVIDTDTGKTSYKKSKKDADTVPYYFLIALHPKAIQSIVILQNFKSSSILGPFKKTFSDFFRGTELGSHYILEINPLVPKELFREYLKNRIIKVRLIKQGFPSDLYNVSDSALPDDEIFTGDVELVIKASRDGTSPMPFLRKFNAGLDKFLDSDSDDIGTIIEVQNFDFETIKVEVLIGGSHRTLDLGKQEKIKYNEDVTGVLVDDDGHPDFSEIDKKAKTFLQDLARSIFGGEIDV